MLSLSACGHTVARRLRAVIELAPAEICPRYELVESFSKALLPWTALSAATADAAMTRSIQSNVSIFRVVEFPPAGREEVSATQTPDGQRCSTSSFRTKIFRPACKHECKRWAGRTG